MISQRVAGDRRGLTLIELLVTLTILAVAGVLVSGAFTTGLRAWQNGLKSGREELVARIVLERIAAQLRSAVSSLAELDREDAAAFFVREDALRFVTLGGPGGAPMQVSYAIENAGEGDHLVYRELPWPDKDFFRGSRPRREEQVPEVTGLSVSVTRKPDPEESSASEPVEKWDPRDLELPGSVELEIVVPILGEPEPRRYRMVVPILGRHP
jgi:prepilin-type N-terminal cleavage/methylation domain-containing protein